MWAYPDLSMMALLLMAVSGDIETGGGGVVGGDARVGRDYTGRDDRPVNVYNQFGDDVHGGHGRRGRGVSDTERIDGLEHDIYGRADYWPGLMRRQNQLIEDLTSLRQQFRTVLFWVYFLMGIIAILVILGVINLIVLRMPV